jgi:hypothetical protein
MQVQTCAGFDYIAIFLSVRTDTPTNCKRAANLVLAHMTAAINMHDLRRIGALKYCVCMYTLLLHLITPFAHYVTCMQNCALIICN